MSIFTEFSNQYGQGVSNGLDMSASNTQTIIHDGSGNHTVVSHMPNGLGGENTYYDGKLVHTNQPNGLGGEMVTDANGHLLRTSVPEHVGDGSSTIHHGIDASLQADGSNIPGIIDTSNATQILGYDDPLVHSNAYIMPKFNPANYQK